MLLCIRFHLRLLGLPAPSKYVPGRSLRCRNGGHQARLGTWSLWGPEGWGRGKSAILEQAEYRGIQCQPKTLSSSLLAMLPYKRPRAIVRYSAGEWTSLSRQVKLEPWSFILRRRTFISWQTALRGSSQDYAPVLNESRSLYEMIM